MAIVYRKDAKKLTKKIKRWNVKLDQKARPCSDGILKTKFGIKIHKFNQKTSSFWKWIKKGDLKEFLKFPFPHKKALEFFFSAHILDIEKKDILLDAAGDELDYLSAVRKTFNPSRLILEDRIYTKRIKKNNILIIGGDASRIPLPDASVNKITCHHSFEHFKQDIDATFIKEISRLLRPKGRAVIIPLFIAEENIECWNTQKNSKFDKTASILIEKTASLPGGSFARVYSPKALYDRVLACAEKAGLKWTIASCTLDNESIPDMKLNFGAKINYPLRALILDQA